MPSICAGWICRVLARGNALEEVRVCEDDSGPGGARDAALIGVLYIGGVRRHQLVDLDLGDYGRNHSLHVQ